STKKRVKFQLLFFLKWWQSSMLFNQDVGLPPFLEPAGDPGWMHVDRLQGGLAGCSWPRYVPAPLFVPYISGPVRPPGQQTSEEQYKWRVSLEVAHFAPSEISLSVRDGFLEVGGKHEERPDEHGFIARCFTRKYRLPAEIHATTVVSTLSVDGILTVEAPVSRTFVPSAVIIPIHVIAAHLHLWQTSLYALIYALFYLLFRLYKNKTHFLGVFLATLSICFSTIHLNAATVLH
uniref:SHSP domain-containing protein n=1 Tax=Cyclopterus lumpus TaxID=8103 RepID=A0A8C3A3E5_CYCLU